MCLLEAKFSSRTTIQAGVEENQIYKAKCAVIHGWEW